MTDTGISLVVTTSVIMAGSLETVISDCCCNIPSYIIVNEIRGTCKCYEKTQFVMPIAYYMM